MSHRFYTNFTVMPTDANYLTPLIFGGAFFSQMDICAAQTVQKVLNGCNARAKHAVTHKAEVTWLKPCYIGDLIHLTGQVLSVSKKSLVIDVRAERQKRLDHTLEYVGSAEFVFVTMDFPQDLHNHPSLPYKEHGITMEDILKL